MELRQTSVSLCTAYYFLVVTSDHGASQGQVSKVLFGRPFHMRLSPMVPYVTLTALTLSGWSLSSIHFLFPIS